MFGNNKLFELTAKLKQLKIRQLLWQECGSIIVFTAVALPILLALMGLGYDVSNLYMHKARLQNVADAAALAGGQAFADSQKKTEGTKDSIDVSTIRKTEEIYNVGGSPKNRTTLHPDADNSADEYIYKNIINLGNTVRTDPYSHFALLSDEDDPKTFYRVGLYEYVDLHFLPIIRGIGNNRRVAVEAIVKIEEDTGSAIPATIFGNLFTYDGYLNIGQGTVTSSGPEALSKKPSDDGATIQMTFNGQIAYTNSGNNFYGIQDAAVEHLYTDEGQATQTSKDLSVSSIGGAFINDPKKTGKVINISEYQAILNSKIELPKQPNVDYIELNMDDYDDYTNFTVANINDLESDLYKRQQYYKINNIKYDLYKLTVPGSFYAEKEFKYAIDTTQDVDSVKRYFSYDASNENNPIMYYIPTNLENFDRRVPAYIGTNSFIDDKGIQYEGNYLLDSNSNTIYYHIEGEYVYFAKDINGVMKQIKKHSRTDDHCFYYDENNLQVLLNYIAIENDKLKNNNTKDIMQIDTNVFHLTGSTNKTLTIDEKVTGGGNLTEPIYIFNDTDSEMRIEANADNVRPIAIVHNSTANVTVEVNNGATFSGVIYASDVNGGSGSANGVTLALNNSHFKGNIAANNISVANTGSSSLTQANYLANDAELYNDIVTYAKDHQQFFEDTSSTSADYSKPPSNTYNNAWQQWYSFVGPEGASTWFNSLNRSQQVAFWRSWDSVNRPKNSDEGLRNQWYSTGWRSNWYFQGWEPTEQEIDDAKADKPVDAVFDIKLRLINTRLELNPFTTISSKR